ncbi:MAG: bifunctional riboflavin kinase/FAD synthetase, partial [Spirochaetota bacterium]
MKIFRSLSEMDLPSHPVVTVGNFDGVHLGHRMIFKEMKRISESAGAQSVVLSFSEHPRKILYPEIHLPVITSLEERMAVIGQCGIDAAVLLDFTRDTASMSAGEFVEKYIVDVLHSSHVVMGYDHAFGRNREGNIDYLLSLGC